jgi:hypothetical protein
MIRGIWQLPRPSRSVPAELGQRPERGERELGRGGRPARRPRVQPRQRGPGPVGGGAQRGYARLVPALSYLCRSTLALDGKKVSGKTLDGSKLTAGKSHTLTGQVSFADGGTKQAVTATLKFLTCPNP